MRVFALGGYGKVGLPAIKLLAQNDLVAEIAVAGRSLERAEKAAREIGEKGIAVQADGTDEGELTSLLAGYDIIVNAATTKAVLPAVWAAIHNRAHYCDVAHGTVIGQALRLAADAEAAGITSIVGNGIAPGIINLMGVHVARQLQEVEQLQNGRACFFNLRSARELTPRQWLKDPKESLAVAQEFRSFIAWLLRKLQENGARTVLDYQDGQWAETDPIRSGVQVPLPQGDTVTSYPVVSGDPLWGALPGDLSRVPPVEVWFSPYPPQLHDVLGEQGLQVLEGTIDSETAANVFYETMERDPHRWLTLPHDFVAIPKEWVRAVGRKEGRAARCNCWFTAPMWNVGECFLTSAALVAAVCKVLRGEVQERGVMTAEKALEPLPFFDEVVSLLPDPLPDGKLIGESFEWLE